MPLTARVPDKKDYDPVPQGVHVAVCYAIFDLGTQYNSHYDKWVHQVLMTWELPNERADFERDGKMENLPRCISQRYTLSLHKKAQLRNDLEAWRGQAFSKDELSGFDLKSVLGAACQLQVIHNVSADGEKTYANVKGIMPLSKGARRPDSENHLLYFSFEDQKDDQLPDNIPTWVVEIITESKEWKERAYAMSQIPQATNPVEAPPPATPDPAAGEPPAPAPAEPEEDDLPF